MKSKNRENVKFTVCELDITDASIKNNMATSIAYVHIHDRPVTKTLHHVVNVTTTEAELFTIRCGINQATNIKDISKLSSSHLFQIHSVAILNDLRKFFL